MAPLYQTLSRTRAVHCSFVSQTPDSETKTLVLQPLQEQRLVPQEDRLYFRPLPRPLPLDFFKGIIVCLSKYENKEHEWFKDLAKRLGAKSIDRLTNSATHVVTKYADGEKYRFMVRKGKPVVTGEWLIACAMQVRLDPVAGWMLAL